MADEELSSEDIENLSQAMASEGGYTVAAAHSQISSAQFMQLEEAAEVAGLPANEMKRMHDVKVHVEVLLGKTRMKLENILQLQEGSIVELDKLAGEPVDITANGKIIARGEIVVVDDNFGVKILEIAGMKKKMGSLEI